MADRVPLTAQLSDENGQYRRFLAIVGIPLLIAVLAIIFGILAASPGSGAIQSKAAVLASSAVAVVCLAIAFVAALASYSDIRRKFGSWVASQVAGTALDELTGIANKTSIMARLEEEVLRAKRTESGFACAVIDIDELGKINDEFGHGDGDSVVKGVATLLRERLRTYDFVGRYDGDEFVLLLPGIDAENGLAACERLRAAIEKNAGDRSGLDYIKVTATFGIAAWEADKDDGERILRRAEAALHRARELGRNRSSG